MNKKQPFFLRMVVIILSCILTVPLLSVILTMEEPANTAVSAVGSIADTYEQNLMNQISHTLDDVIPIRKNYSLNDSDLVAPKPSQNCYGQTSDPAEMVTVLTDAELLLEGQTTLFTPQTSIKPGSSIYYYLDETILAITWKQVVDDSVYTFSEVKIAHPSQFRRFFSEGKYNSGILHTTTEMSESVNAVVASSGDYYSYRTIGIVVNEGKVYQDRGHFLDTCYIDDRGDLLFSYAREITDRETAEKFVKENNIRFSLCFGPLMVLDGEYCVPATYNSGEINSAYARAALCQMDSLHYVVVTANTEEPNYGLPTVGQFGRRLQEMGIPTAYALDGGQTASIVMNNQLINTVSYGSQRDISDIIYFATALPERDEVDK